MRMGAPVLVLALLLLSLPWAPAAATQGRANVGPGRQGRANVGPGRQVRADGGPGRRSGPLSWLWTTAVLRSAGERHLVLGRGLVGAEGAAPAVTGRSLVGAAGVVSVACTPPSPCAGTLAPNNAVFEASQGALCNCSAPLVLVLGLANTSALAWTAPQAALLRASVAEALQLQPTQVWLADSGPASAPQQNATLWVFPASLSDWNAVDVSVMVARALSNSSITGLPGVASTLVSAATGSAYPAPTAISYYFPPAAPGQTAPPLLLATPPGASSGSTGDSSSSSSSSVPWWSILVMVLLGALALAACAAAAWSLWKLRQARQQEPAAGTAKEPLARVESKTSVRKQGPPLSPTDEGPLATPPRTTRLSMSLSRGQTSEFGLKVADNFVKALSLEDLVAATDNFNEANALGSGGYGTVYKGVGPGGVLWAVKRAKNASEEAEEDFQNEVDVISKMSHRNLVKLLGYCDEQGEQILVYELVPNGTLRQHIRPDNPSMAALTFQQRLEIAVGAAEGIKYLHSFAERPIIHRDIKCDNILLDMDMQAKVADFGVFKRSPTAAETGKTMNTRVVGTPGYVDPEYYQTYKVTVKSDVYSFGVVLLELLTGRPPIMEDPAVENESYMVTLSRWATPKIAAGKVESIVDPRLSGSYPRQALNMMAAITSMCVRRLGRDRPEMAEVATRLAEIKYFLKPSSGILEPVMNLFPDDPDDDESHDLVEIPEEEGADRVPEFIPGTTPGVNPYATADIAAPVSMVFSDR